MFPELVSSSEKKLLTKFLNGSPLFKIGPLGNVSYSREVDLTLGKASGRFIHVDAIQPTNANPTLFEPVEGNQYTPVLEGRMVGQFDCFQKSYVSGSGRKAVWESNRGRTIASCRSQYVAVSSKRSGARLAICDITSATNTRTVMATLVPENWICGNTAPVLSFANKDYALAALLILNSLCFDWMARRIVSGLHLNKFYLDAMCWPAADDDTIAALASMSSSICRALPRSGLFHEPNMAPGTDVTEVLASAEVMIARAYGLTDDELHEILSMDKSDRRGFWRYFHSSGAAVRTKIIEHMQRNSTSLAA
jgi:hypothetical protein